MSVYLITDFLLALGLTLMLIWIMRIPIKISFSRKRLITRIEKELSANYNYFNIKKSPKYEHFIEKIIIESSINLKVQTLYFICFLLSIFGGYIGYSLQFPVIILILIVTFFMFPIFILFMIGAYKNFKSYKSTFKVLHIAEKASQLTNSPLIVFRKILPYLYERDKIYFEEFLKSFDANKPYMPLFEDLEKKINNKFLKELVINGRETSNGVNYNQAINLTLQGYRIIFELMQKRREKINGMVYFLYILSIAFIILSFYFTNQFSVELHNLIIAQIFFKVSILVVILGVIFGSFALINANQC